MLWWVRRYIHTPLFDTFNIHVSLICVMFSAWLHIASWITWKMDHMVQWLFEIKLIFFNNAISDYPLVYRLYKALKNSKIMNTCNYHTKLLTLQYETLDGFVYTRNLKKFYKICTPPPAPHPQQIVVLIMYNKLNMPYFV